jgi:hypothetical protein
MFSIHLSRKFNLKLIPDSEDFVNQFIPVARHSKPLDSASFNNIPNIFDWVEVRAL